MATGETFKATIIMRGNAGTAFVNDFGYVDLSSGSTHLDTGIAAGNFQTLVQAAFAAVLPTVVSFVRYRFACVSGGHVGEIGYVDVDPEVTGSNDDVPLPAELAISMKRSTGHASRRDRGRIFFGPVISAYRDGTNPDFCTNDDASLRAVAALLKADLVTGGVTLKPVILSAAGTYSGRVINQSSIAKVFVHHKSRRFRVGI